MIRSQLTFLFVVAALLASPSALGAGVSPDVATTQQREQSQARFLHGKELFDARQYTDAMAEFRAASEIVASPNARLFVARCLRETGRLAQAYVEFDRTAADASADTSPDRRYAPTGEAARAERDAIAPKIGFLTARVDHAGPGTRVRVGAEEISQGAWNAPVPVMPGSTEVVVETPPSPPIRRTVTVAAGEKKGIVIDVATAQGAAVALAPSPTGRRGLRRYAYVAGGLGVVGLATFAIAGALSDATYSDLSSQCGKGPCPASKASEVSRGQAEQTAADVALAIGGAALATGVTLFVLSLPPKREGLVPGPAAPTAKTELSIAPGWLGVRGSF